MKSVIILLAFVAFTSAEDDDGWKECGEQAEKFKQCIGGKMTTAAKENGAQLKQFFEEAKKCFDLPETKDICKLPEMPDKKPEQASLTHARPSHAANKCFKGAASSLAKCMENELGIKNLLQNHNFQQQQQGGMQGHQFGGHFSPPSKEDMHKMAMNVCQNNTAAADALKKCGEEKAKPYAKALGAMMFPMVGICKYKSECLSESPITEDCTEKLKKGAQAFCNCRKEGVNFYTTSSDCKSVRESFGPQAAQTHESSTNNYHDMAHQPGQGFDFCADLDKDVCAEIEKKIEEWKSKHEQEAGGDDAAAVASE